MRKIVASLVLLCIISSVFAQTKKSNYGYILKNNQDSIKGYFVNKAEFFDSKSVDFIVDPISGKTQNFNVADIVSGKSETIEIVSVHVKTSTGFENIIAEKLIVGKYASLYKSYKLGEEFFYIEKDTSIIEISPKYFIGSINVLLGDCKKLQSDVKNNDPNNNNYKYKESVFAQLVVNYNKCKGSASDFTVIKKSPFINRAGVFVGITSSIVSFDKSPYDDVDFKRTYTPTLGIIGSITYKDFITFESGLSYTYLKSSGDFSSAGTVLSSSGDFTTIDVDANLDYKIHLIQIPLSLKLNLFKISNFQPYIKGGLSLDWAAINKSYAVAGSGASIYEDEIKYPIINYSIFWGLGVNIHNSNNTLYFIDLGINKNHFNSTPISSFSWAMSEITGTSSYINLRIGKTF